MSDEDTTQDTPEVTPAAPTTEAPDPYEKRYNDLRPQWDKTNTLLDKARNGDVDAIRELGFAIEDEEDDDEPDYAGTPDPTAKELAELRKELDDQKAWRNEQEQQRLASQITGHIGDLTKDQDLTQEEKDWIFTKATIGDISNEKTEAEVKKFLEWRESQRNAWVEQYRTTKNAPRVGTGTAAGKQPDLDNDEERVAHMMAQIDANRR